MFSKHADGIESIDEKAYREMLKWQDEQLARGVQPHEKQIPRRENDREYVKMYRFTVLDKVMELKSEPFSTEDEARHFMECFNDSFILRASISMEEGKYYVYSGWMPVFGFMSYSMNAGQKGQYFVFANWS